MEDEKKVTPEQVITKVSDNLDIILGDINIIFDTNQEGIRIKMLRKFITENDLKESYDYIFIDSPQQSHYLQIPHSLLLIIILLRLKLITTRCLEQAV